MPKYPSTDLAYSLAPNGHGGGPALNDLYESSQGTPGQRRGRGQPDRRPQGELHRPASSRSATRRGSSRRAPPTTRRSRAPTTTARGRIPSPPGTRAPQAGDPTPDSDPIIHQIRRGLTEFRGAYYQDEGWSQQVDSRKVAVFSIQGWTDDLFPAVESFRMFKYLKRLDPRWPVEVALADVGHSRAQNKPDTWHRLNDQACQWLQSNIDRSHEQQTTVSSEATVCGDHGAPQHVVGRTPEDAGEREPRRSSIAPGGTQGDAARDRSERTRPPTRSPGDIVQPGEPCRQSNGPAVGGYTQYSPPLASTETYVGLGFVRIPYVWTGGGSGMLAARLFDAAPDGTELLMTRGVVPLRERPDDRRDQAPAVRQPLAARAGPPHPARPDAGRRAHVQAEQRPLDVPVPERRLARATHPVAVRAHFPGWRTRRCGAGARRRGAVSTGGAGLSRQGSPGWSSRCSWPAGCSRSAATGAATARREAPPKPPSLPRGGRTILPDFRVVAYYGAPQDDELGILGIGPPRLAAKRLERQAKPYARPRRPVLPAMELIAAIVTSEAGDGGDHSMRQDASTIRRYLRVARSAPDAAAARHPARLRARSCRRRRRSSTG